MGRTTSPANRLTRLTEFSYPSIQTLISTCSSRLSVAHIGLFWQTRQDAPSCRICRKPSKLVQQDGPSCRVSTEILRAHMRTSVSMPSTHVVFGKVSECSIDCYGNHERSNMVSMEISPSTAWPRKTRQSICHHHRIANLDAAANSNP